MTSDQTKADGAGRTSVGVGLLGGLIASVCCAAPAAAMALGLGGLSGLVGLSVYQPYFLVGSLLFVAGSSWYLAGRWAACCVGEERQWARYRVVGMAVGTYLVVYILVNYLVVPALYGAMPGM